MLATAAYPPVVASATTAASNAGLKGRAGVSSTLGGRMRPCRVAPLDPLKGFIPACRDFPWEPKIIIININDHAEAALPWQH